MFNVSDIFLGVAATVTSLFLGGTTVPTTAPSAIITPNVTPIVCAAPSDTPPPIINADASGQVVAPSTVFSQTVTWKTYSDENISFQYPSDWVISKSETDSQTGTAYKVFRPSYSKTKTVPFFAIYITNKDKFESKIQSKASIDNFLDPYATYTDVIVNNHRAKRARIKVSQTRTNSSENITIDASDKNKYIQITTEDIGINFDKQITVWFNPILDSIQIN
jgi:hypothetical protein